MTLVPNASIAADLICAKCGKPISQQPGQTYRGSTDGGVWHYGCWPNRATTTNVRHHGFEQPKHEGAERQAAIETKKKGNKCPACEYRIPPDSYHECWTWMENGKRVYQTQTLINKSRVRS